MRNQKDQCILSQKLFQMLCRELKQYERRGISLLLGEKPAEGAPQLCCSPATIHATIPRKSLKRLATTVVPIPKTLRTLCSAPKVPDTSSPGIRRTTTCIYQTSNRRLCVEQNWIKNRLFYYHKQKAALTNSCESRTFTSFFKVSFILFFRCLFGLLNILSIF